MSPPVPSLEVDPARLAGRAAPGAELAPAAELLKALAHPVRLGVVRALRDGPLCVHELVGRVQVSQPLLSQPLLSQHLRVLRDARLIGGTRRGKEIAYGLTDSRVSQLVDHALRHAERQASLGVTGAAGPEDLLEEDLA